MNGFPICILIDDDPLDIFINTKVLKSNNFASELIVCKNGDEALDLLRDNKVKPDIIFLDIRMPVMDGFQFLEEYDKLSIDKSHTKIVMLSSTVNPVDIERAKTHKYITRFLDKPLTTDSLMLLTM